MLFEFEGCEHLEQNNPAIDEIRISKTVSYVARGPLMAETAKAWAEDIADLMPRQSKRCIALRTVLSQAGKSFRSNESI